jgi:hypothetical protein
VALAHTYNSRGELGTFVNPYACSCVTCVNHVARESVPFGPVATEPALSSTTLDDMYREMRSDHTGLSNESYAPVPAPAPSLLPQRSMGGGIGLLPSSLLALGRSTGAGGSSTVTEDVPSVALGRAETGFGGASFGALARSSSSPFFMPPRLYSFNDDEEFCDALRSYRATLQLLADDIGRGVDHPTDAQRTQWAEEQAEFDRKIRGIEDCLLAFNSFFRTR